ncbi:hypothetical protein COV23_00920 [Candidatus Wolfebacteria bacterium CG10_big_fil_rev_8_21_14_0_10_31_9]|uniref:Sec-independent protein translocase protein TatC n=1 Tax=Candidatus Wolfebacteria bacterium CG10_big_fil_rev_8_21_14_0_10_31_9 TaxID=1975070 RepID=A0A2H0RCS6_9BACT|nr:MAG: hypothetical protein COV23_00920 [Candidatus Wolfebacteria bacterium CG10_big_fil_rev_8_21_14_0_10_31_9]
MNDLIKEYTPYFEELRNRLFFLVVFFIAVFGVSFFFSGYIIKLFLGFFKIENVQMIITTPFQFVDLAVNTGLVLAIIITFPLIIYNIFSFLKHGLTKREKKIFTLIIPVSIFLFFLGFAFGFSVMYYALIALAGFSFDLGIANMWDVSLFSSQILLTASLLGIIFQFPIALTVLIRIGVIDIDSLKKKRRWAIALSFILPALLPPTDGLSLIIMALPVILLFEIILLINRKYKIKSVESYT